ncbi:hypothetical protein [Allokutzneria sp. NRRL B-24872]|uniref:hypothetical protein n=1 Tax=Allokutzneria sp. NRRL B-24872 TaxID=1137961 RepID=UPI000A3A9BEE|nr:hypothetical protein [Allokutzneria sp. NRRL B-24872]
MRNIIRRASALGVATAALASFSLASAGTAQAAEFKQWGPYPTYSNCIGEGRFREAQLQVDPGWACLNPFPHLGWYVAGYKNY